MPHDYVKYGKYKYRTVKYRQRIRKAASPAIGQDVKYRLRSVRGSKVSDAIVNQFITINGHITKVRINSVVSQSITIDGPMIDLRIKSISGTNQSAQVISTINKLI